MMKEYRKGLRGYSLHRILETGKSSGHIYFPADKSDMKFIFDKGIFFGTISKKEPLDFVLFHKKCGEIGIIDVRFDTDKPKHKLTCIYCLKVWEYHQLDKISPNDFSSLFEYRYSPKSEWPSVVKEGRNGISKFTYTTVCFVEEAAEYFYKEFQGFKANGFMWKTQ